jgi:hypothetical protein
MKKCSYLAIKERQIKATSPSMPINLKIKLTNVDEDWGKELLHTASGNVN